MLSKNFRLYNHFCILVPLSLWTNISFVFILTRNMSEGHIAEARISTRGQIAIPKKVMEKMGAREQEYILFYEDKGRIYIEAGHLTSRRKEQP